MESKKNIKALIVGLGSIGKRHETNLKQLGVTDFLYLHHGKEDKKVPHHYYRLEDAINEKPTIAIITNPSSLHVPLATKLARAGIHLFIEKPLSNTLRGVNTLTSEAKKKKLVVMVGLNFRFHPQVQKIRELLETGVIGKALSADIAVGQYLPDWHPGEDYRKNYTAREDLGGGVALTLIHEIDYAGFWFGKAKTVFALLDRVSNLGIETEDVAEFLVKYKNGTLTHIHLDYLARAPFRTANIIGEKGTITWNYFTKEIKLYTSAKSAWDTFPEPQFDRNDMFMLEMKAFLDAVDGRTQSPIDLGEALESLKVVLAGKKASKQKKIVLI